jgi:hypothetical protein
MTKPQKIVEEFEDSRMLGALFTLILAVWYIFAPAPLIPSLLSVFIGVIIAGTAVGFMWLHRYGVALGVIRSKFWIVLVLGLFLYFAGYTASQLGLFAMAVYAGFRVAFYGMSFAVYERITFIRIGADMESPDVQAIFKKDRRTSRAT